MKDKIENYFKSNRGKMKNLVFAIIFLAPIVVVAQLPGFDPNVDDEVAAPIDGFVGVAALAGAVYGIRRKQKGKQQGN